MFALSMSLDSPIVGKWQGVDKYLIYKGDTVDFTFDGKGYSNNSILVFSGNNRGVEFPGETEFKYHLEDDKLIIGNRVFTVHEITERELILVDVLLEDLAYWIRFKKVYNEN
ncbi:hypothetical protein MM213_11455 [Belliella sp. R4-6]|uniref:Lipocalin-like domain-containing protein n=1 Tax=Belliella alkalica TaxID=1730871 RepID=A0ABS9VCE4_9BACT|nr:hypothetical protein [Belliella alkalica]MCH7414106.1 hypothetical protein [Belliella alkalica]